MKRQERRGAYADGDLSDSSSAEEKCPESEQQPVTRCQAWRSLARTAQDDQLLLEQKILRDHRAHATGATLGLTRFRGRVRTWVSSALLQLSPLVVDG